MNTSLEDRLHADMARFTRDVRVPSGLAVKAYHRGRRRRARLRAALAAAATAALAAGAVTATEATGVFESATAPPIQTTAYIVKQVDSALSPDSLANMIRFTRTVYTPGQRLTPLAGQLLAGSPQISLGPQWTVATTLTWIYQGIEKDSAYSPSGQHLFDITQLTGNDSGIDTAVLYNHGTWWTTSYPTLPLKSTHLRDVQSTV